MGLFGFGGSKIDRLVKRLTNPWVQTQDRIRCMEVLADMGSEESLYGLMQRFTYRTEASITDEDEKQVAFRLLVDTGPSAIPAIERFVSSNDAVYWPLKALKEIAGLETAVELLLRSLDRAEGKDQRVNEQKVQLVSNLRDFPHPKVQERLAALVRDSQEDVRIMALDGLMTYGPEVAAEAAVGRVLDPDESPAVKTVVLEQLVDQGWKLDKWRSELNAEGVLPLPYQLSRGGQLTRGG